MLESLQIENFRGFEDSRVPLRETTIVVGGNNAGKSTLVEALRLVALVTSRFLRGTGRFVPPPSWLDHPAAFEGLSPALRGAPSDGAERNLFFRYGYPPAVLTARFATGATVLVFVGPESQLHGVARRPDGSPITRATSVHSLGLAPIAVQPQVAPLLREEPVRQDQTIRRGDGTYLAPQHFRNQLLLYGEYWDKFCAIAEDSWPQLQVESVDPEPRDAIQLLIRDADFVGEVALMGHGLQMWLQIVWFLARAPQQGTVVLDEPDVYMHPDLQRRLLELVRTGYEQLVIATHSVEIISDVDPRAILSVDRRLPESTFVSSLPGVQAILDGLGSVQNIQVTRLMRSRSFCLLEGDDLKLLRILQSTSRPEQSPVDLVPNAELGGRGGWGSGVPGRIPTKNAEGEKIRTFAVLDRDYFPDAEISERYAEARQWRVQLRIWTRKEIENFLLVPAAIARLIAAGVPNGGASPSAEVVASEIDAWAEAMRTDVSDRIATEFLARDKKGGVAKANPAARRVMDARWKTPEGRLASVPGKAMLRKISQWAQDTYGVSFGAEQIARELLPSEVDPEIIEVVSAVAAGRPLRKPFEVPAG
jgi:energy-coupling factor transporter ATP-binding protein EcfA2